MKIGILKGRNRFGHKNKGGTDTYIHLLVETLEDVNAYYSILNERNAKENIDLYLGFKSQSFRKDIGDYAVHEAKTKPETRALLMQLYFKETKTSLVEYCQMSDNVVSRKILSFIEYIEKGKVIRVNHNGGYCFVDGSEDYDELFEPTTEQLESFIRKGDLDKPEINLTKEVLVVENSGYLSSNFEELLKVKNFVDYDTIFNLKETLRFLTDDEIVKVFVKAVNNGLKIICFETTGQDLHQLKKMEILLTRVKYITEKDISLLIKTYRTSVTDIFKDNFNLISHEK